MKFKTLVFVVAVGLMMALAATQYVMHEKYKSEVEASVAAHNEAMRNGIAEELSLWQKPCDGKGCIAQGGWTPVANRSAVHFADVNVSTQWFLQREPANPDGTASSWVLRANVATYGEYAPGRGFFVAKELPVTLWAGAWESNVSKNIDALALATTSQSYDVLGNSNAFSFALPDGATHAAAFVGWNGFERTFFIDLATGAWRETDMDAAAPTAEPWIDVGATDGDGFLVTGVLHDATLVAASETGWE